MKDPISKPLILLDVDGVLADFRDTYVRVCNELHGTSFEVAATGPGFHFAQSMGLTREQNKAVWDRLASPGVVSGMSTMLGARYGVSRLCRLGRVLFVTAPSPTPYWVMERQQWLKRTFAGAHPDPGDSVIFCPGPLKHHIPGDVFIDDHYENVDAWKTAWPEGLGYTVTPPAPPNWADILTRVEQHIQQRRPHVERQVG